MRTRLPRITPVVSGEETPEQRQALALFARRPYILNIFRTLARAPVALERFAPWAGYILGRNNSLTTRDRELLILRTGWNCRSGYEWAQHVPIGREAGLDDADIAAIKQGPRAPHWPPRDAALLTACDELVADQFVTDATWAALSALSERQRMDVVFTVAQYTQVAMVLNSFGVQLDPGQQLDPDFAT